MAIGYIRTDPVSRTKGRSAVACASYRAGVCLVDERVGKMFDYTHRSGVEYAELLMPDNAGMAAEWNREQLWNAAEAAEKRKDSRVAREWTGALPVELTREQRIEVSREFAKEMASSYGVAIDFALHEPGKHGDDRNYHVHYLATTRVVVDGELKEKASLEKGLDNIHLVQLRDTWEKTVNSALDRAGVDARIDMRPFAEQREDAITAGDVIRAATLDRHPDIHVGWQATAMERRGLESERGAQLRQIHEQNHARQQQALERARTEVMARSEQRDAERRVRIEQERKAQAERLESAIVAVDKTRGELESVGAVRQALVQVGAVTPEQQQAQIKRWAEMAAQPKIDIAARAREIYCEPQKREFFRAAEALSSTVRNLNTYESAHPKRVNLADHGFLGIRLLRWEDKQLTGLRNEFEKAKGNAELAEHKLKSRETEYDRGSGGPKMMALERANDEAKVQGMANAILEQIEKTPHTRAANLDEVEQHLQFVLQTQIETQRQAAVLDTRVAEADIEESQPRQYKGGNSMAEMEALRSSLTSEDQQRIERFASAELAHGTDPSQVREAIEKWMLPESPAAREYAHEVVDRHSTQQDRAIPERDASFER